MGINTSKTLVHNIFDEQITMAKKNYESYLKMMGIEIANPSYPKNSIVIELTVGSSYYQTNINPLIFINEKVGYEYTSYGNWIERVIANTCSSLPKSDDGSFNINAIKIDSVNFLDLTGEMNISYSLSNNSLSVTDKTMNNKGLKLKVLIKFKESL